jgi:NADPH2:quinone reductase
LDLVGGDYIARDLSALAMDGRITCISTAGGTAATLDLRVMIQRRASIMGSQLRSRSVEQKAEIARKLLQDVWPRLPVRDPVRPVVDSVFKMEDAAAAHRRLEGSLHVGKIVLTWHA